MRKYKYDEIIQVVVDWWANTLLTPKYDNGEGDNALAMLTRIASSRIASQQIKSFRSNLGRHLRINFTVQKIYYLGVDYNPCLILTKILSKSRIKSSIVVLPWKTNMWINEEGVKVSCGYRAPIDILYSINK